MDESQVGYIQIKIRECLDALKQVETRVTPLEKMLVNSEAKLKAYEDIHTKMQEMQDFKAKILAGLKTEVKEIVENSVLVINKDTEKRFKQLSADKFDSIDKALEKIDGMSRTLDRLIEIITGKRKRIFR